MAWFKVDDKLHSHPKRHRAGLRAMGLWVIAGSWCGDQLTDGYVPAYMLASFGAKPADAQALVSAELWVEMDDGWLFRDWDDYQPTRDDVHDERDYRRRSSDLHRDKELVLAIRERDADRCRYCGVLVDFKARRGPSRGTYSHIDAHGPNTLANVVVACGSCSSSKGRKSLEEWGKKLREPREF